MDQSKIGKFIMERRRAKGLTQVQLAQQLHITDRAVSKWETGKSLPDSSIMLALCGILEITADELLSGGRRGEEAQPAAAPPPDLPERRSSRRARWRWWGSILFSGGLFTGTLICFLCDAALSGELGWSLIVALSAGYGWIVLLPLLALKRGGMMVSLLILSWFTIPYLHELSRLLGVGEIVAVGDVLALISIAFLWLIFAAFCRLGRTPAALGAGFLLLAGLTAALNGALYFLGAAPAPSVWSGLSVLLLLLAAAGCFTWKRRRENL